MKVICIDVKPRKVPVNELVFMMGYTVISESSSGNGYILSEVKSPYASDGSYFQDRFIPISDIDETELAKQLMEELV
jgi:hypothetical protein